MFWHQTDLMLAARPRGVHLVTHDVQRSLASVLPTVRIGLLHVFLQHTSASIGLGENASPDVRRDLERYFNHAVPDGDPMFEHDLEGPDDMPAHVKSATVGVSLTLPVRGGALALGTWQGLYLYEHRDHGGPRTLVLTLSGETG